jgi:PHD/YefM family antitoxin component YafN of YafNO toxin-antitoxin module
MTEFMTARRFNQDTAGAKRAAEAGPVYITDRGRPSHVLLAFDEYARLAGAGDLVTSIGSDVAAGEIELELGVERTSEVPRPVDL